MIRPFELGDLDNFEANENSTIEDIMPVFVGDEYQKFTLVTGGAPKAIICFRDNGNRDWAGFLLVSRLFTAREGLRIKLFLDEMVKKYKPVRFWTASRTGGVLGKWHKFLGMEVERPVTINGRECLIWGLRCGEAAYGG